MMLPLEILHFLLGMLPKYQKCISYSFDLLHFFKGGNAYQPLVMSQREIE